MADDTNAGKPAPLEGIERVHGIDFSGDRSAGKRSWVASGDLGGTSLKVDACRDATELPGSAAARETFLEALNAWITEQPGAAIGLDFPFSLPEAVIEEDSWEAFVRGFAKRFPDEDEFRFTCQRVSPGRELKRATDEAHKAPLSPYNLRLYKQTYHGIANVLAPLIEADAVRVAPFQEPDPDKPLLVEVCPAASMIARGHKTSYKGTTQEHRAARTRILKALQSDGTLSIRAQGVLTSVLRDSGGDALDAVIAAYAATQAVSDHDRLYPDSFDGPAIEGNIYA